MCRLRAARIGLNVAFYVFFAAFITCCVFSSQDSLICNAGKGIAGIGGERVEIALHRAHSCVNSSLHDCLLSLAVVFSGFLIVITILGAISCHNNGFVDTVLPCAVARNRIQYTNENETML